MSAMASPITSLTIVFSTVYSAADQTKHQSSASLAFVRNSSVISEFPAQMASNAENVSIWWRPMVYHATRSTPESQYMKCTYTEPEWQNDPKLFKKML